jgi:hypothetical protein
MTSDLRKSDRFLYACDFLCFERVIASLGCKSGKSLGYSHRNAILDHREAIFPGAESI